MTGRFLVYLMTIFNCINYERLNVGVIVSEGLKRKCKEVEVTYFKVIFPAFSVRIKPQNFQKEQPVPGPSFKPETSQVRCRYSRTTGADTGAGNTPVECGKLQIISMLSSHRDNSRGR